MPLLAHVSSRVYRATANKGKSQIGDARGRAGLRVFGCVLILFCAASAALGQTPRPVLLSDPNSTRALALDSVTHAPEPFAPESPIGWGGDRRTRVTLFAMNLALGAGEGASAVAAFAEDASGRRYTLKTEYVGGASGAAGVSELIVRLSDDLGDVGDVLVWISYGGLASNRVRVGIGHAGGGPADDAGAVPTQPVLLAGSVIQNNEGLAGVDVTLLGGISPVTFRTGADGSYFFVAAPLGTYTLTPSATFYDFEPASRTLDSVETSRTGLFFGAHRQTHAIFGQLHDDDGRELFNVTITLTSTAGFEPRTTATDDSGQFTFFEVPAGFDYTVTPLDNEVANFTPAQTGQLLEDVSLNLTGKRKTYAIRGVVRDDVGPVEGASISLEGYDSKTTDASGAYDFENVLAGFDYMLSASDPEHTYAQGVRTIENLEHDVRVDFDATPHFVLSGRVADASGRGLLGVIVEMSGKQTAGTYTDADGRYSLVATAHGDYTVTPSQYQDYYSFTPPSATLANVGSSRAEDFSATLSSFSSPSYVLEFDGTPKDVDYSIVADTYTPFWPEHIDLGHFFWEVWAMPGENAGATYMLADGYGGAHAILFGVANFGTSEPGRYQLLGNIWDGSEFTYFNSDEGPAPGEWGHFAAGWDGQYVVTYFNGVPVGRTKWAGPRRTPGPAGGGGRLYVGGSNHSNFVGRIAQVRGYEDSNPREDNSVYDAFRPETVFSVDGNLLSWYFRPAQYMADLSPRGYQGLRHSGAVRGWAPKDDIYPCFTCPKPEFVVDPTAPNFADPEHPGTPPAPVAPPAPVPSGARVFDSFSRHNSTYSLGGIGGLGSTEGGTKGALAWRTNVAAGGPQPFGILNGRGVLLANANALAWVEVGDGFDDFDVRVSRRSGAGESGRDTGLSFRVADSSNYFFAYTTQGTDLSPRLLTVGYFSNGQRTTLANGLSMPATWTTLRVKTNAAGLLEVYADNTRVYATQNALMSTAAGAGLYNNGPGLALTNRWDNFTIFATPVN